MSEVSRLSASEVREGVLAGTTLLVCAYDDDAKFERFRLEGAIPLTTFKEKVLSLEKETRIVFYCA